MEVGLALGSSFLSAFLQVAFDRIASSRKFLDLFQGKKDTESDEKDYATSMDKLMITLHKIKLVLEDAEDKQGAEAVRRWLGKVKAKVNHAEDLLDELNTECLRHKLDYEFQHKPTEALKMKSEADRKLKSEADLKLKVDELMKKLIDVTRTLEDFVKQINELGLRKLDSKEKYSYLEPSSSVVDKSEIFGRDAEKEKLIDMLFNEGGSANMSVIAITGMGGIGKTTLAQLVYNDDRVKDKFQTRAWVCVSEVYDALRITKALLMEVHSADVKDKDDFNRLQVKLKDNLEEKCFLIILDDIWNENYNDWSLLKNPLKYGSRGSKIIITTRNQKVARMMQNEPFHHVEPITDEASLSLFNTHASDNEDHTLPPEFKTIGEEIVKKCKGLPLGIKTVAGALRPERDVKVWQNFLSSGDWAVGGDILPALSLSYKHLPSHLKCCFAFCALFHKDVPFDKDEAVLLWMANDLVKPSTLPVGRVYFEELKLRSFFELKDGNKYIMHDLINDLARSVTVNTCIRLEDYEAADMHQIIQRENEIPSELQHFSYLSNYSDVSTRFNVLAEVHSLRTFLSIHKNEAQCENNPFFFSDSMFKGFKHLRALNLSQYRISVLPDSLGDLQHLRFLNLASTNIQKIPNAVSKCLNLQTLILANCEELVELPKDMRLLINLQHLDIRSVGEPLIKKMATWLSRFEDIQNIFVIVDKIQGSELELLVRLQLYHSLNIIGLGDTDVDITEKAGLYDKDSIENLTLEWSGIAKSLDEELTKFVKLQPHANIKQLTIKGYKGRSFPEWIGDSGFSNMESLYLEDCKSCLSLPRLGQLSGLKKLYISGMDGISEIGKEFYGDASKPFQSLQELEFRDMAEWVVWKTFSDVDFSSLESLKITDCKNILSFPEGGLAAPKLKMLVVKRCKKMKSLPAKMHTQLSSLSDLEIESCPEIECFSDGDLLPCSLEKLSIWYCEKFTNWGSQRLSSLIRVSLRGFDDISFPEEGLLPTNLQDLDIGEFGNMVSLNVEGLQHLSSLRSLCIRDCQSLKNLPKLSSPLEEMGIWSCVQLESFTEGIVSSISKLNIDDCPKLTPRMDRPNGVDWPKVSKCLRIQIDGSLIQNLELNPL